MSRKFIQTPSENIRRIKEKKGEVFPKTNDEWER